MSTLDDLFDKAKALVNVAGKKTGEVVEVSKLKLQAVQINTDIQKAYEKIGSIVYEHNKAGTDAAELIQMCIKEVDGLFHKLNEINEKIAGTKNMAICLYCGASVPVDSYYCPKCGANLAEETVSEEKETPKEESSATQE